MSQVYKHPDGHEINIARGVMTMTNDADESVSVPIGKLGLRELGEHLINLSKRNFTDGECSDKAAQHALNIHPEEQRNNILHECQRAAVAMLRAIDAGEKTKNQTAQATTTEYELPDDDQDDQDDDIESTYVETDPGCIAEIAGAELGYALTNDLLDTNADHRDRHHRFKDALMNFAELPRRDRAADGLVAQLLPYLEKAMNIKGGA